VLNIIVAFIAAPFVGVLLSALVVTPFFGEFAGWDLFFAFGLFFAYPSAFLVGLPLYLLAKRVSGSPRLWQFMLGGVASAVPGLYFVLAPSNSLYFERTWHMNTTLCLVAGAVSGAALWLIMRGMRSNPSIGRTCPGKPGHAAHVKR
jgi:hypothetical protein